MTQHKPFFSVIIPTRDRPRLVEDLVKSILVQDFDNYELIISDNSKGNETQDFIKKHDISKIKNLRMGNLNMADNWENAIKSAEGKYVLLFSDKMLLKMGAFRILERYIEIHQPECITWNLDSFYDKPKLFYSHNTAQEIEVISSKELLKDILSSDLLAYDRAPFHCNSCISSEVLSRIKSRNQRICMQLNPDYTMSYQCVLNSQYIHKINTSLSILRFPDFKESYGNGNSFMKKGDQAKSFMDDNADWILRVGELDDIPLKGNKLLLDHILKDLYNTLKIYRLDPNEIIQKEERLKFYYKAAYREIILRQRMEVDMSKEMKMWRESLLKEVPSIEKEVLDNIEEIFGNYGDYFKILMKKVPFLNSILGIASKIFLLLKGKKYNSISTLIEQTKIS